MADQPDIIVTDTTASPPGHVTVTVDGHSTILPKEDAGEFIRQEINDYNK